MVAGPDESLGATHSVSAQSDLLQTWMLHPDLLVILDHDGVFDRTNPAWQTTLGWSEEALRAISFVSLVHPDDTARAHVEWVERMAGDPVMRFENRYRHADGGWRWLQWVVVPHGEKFYGSARDVTLEKEREASLAAVQEALRHSQKMEAIGQLTGGVAHDFNNLLTVIRGSVELLQRPGLSDERRERYIGAIAQTAERATTLTGQLLAFARRQALKPEAFDVDANLDAVTEMISSLTGSRITVERRRAPEPCFVEADQSQFDTAIVNMIVNARDAMEGQGRIIIAVRRADTVPAVRGRPDSLGDFVAVSITDSGKGIAEANLDHIFEPFFTTKTVGAGTGLGLSQVIGFARQSKGEVRVQSTLDRGATFTLYLPRTRAVESAVAPVRGPSPATGEGRWVLVVEDNPEVGAFATEALREIGFESVLAVSADAALQRLQHDAAAFDVVFSDVVLPGMSGLEMAAIIRSRHPTLPVVLASGYSHALAQSADRGFELLNKPYSIDELARAFDRVLSRRKAYSASSDEVS